MNRLVLLLAFAVLAIPSIASAQSTSELADAVERRGYFADAGTVAINDIEELVIRHPAIGFVALATETSDADFTAEDVLAGVSARTTVIVLTPSEVGVASSTYDDAQIARALDDAFATTGDDYLTDFSEFADAIAGVVAVATTIESPAGREQAETSGGFSIWWLVLAGVVVVGFVMWRNSRRDADTVERRLTQAKAEVEAQMAEIANQILALSDRVSLSEDPTIEGHFRRGNDTYREAEDRLGRSTNQAELEALSDDLDLARWELSVVAALLDGEDPPPEPPEDEIPQPCFFDPTHGAGTEIATLRTKAGERNVMVCRADAERLRRGERPQPREIEVGRRRFPAPQAPRSHGGRGLDWLDVFSVIVGGAGEAARYRWNPRGRRSSGGGFGGLGSGLGGGRRRSPQSAPARPPSPPKTKGRGRRSR